MAGRLGNERASMLRQTGQDYDRALKIDAAGVDNLGKAVEQHQANTEITNGMMGLADTIDQLDQHYNQAANAPEAQTDPNFTENWRKSVMDPALAQFKSQFNTPEGQRWAATHVAQAATELYRHTTAADMNRSADQAQAAFTQGTNTLSGMAGRNPGMTDMAIDMVSGTVDAIAKNANLSPEAVDKLRTTLTQQAHREITVAGVRATIDADPNAGDALLSSGKYDKYLTPEDQAALQRHVSTMTRMNTATIKAQDTAQIKAEDDRVKAAALSLQGSTITADGPRITPDFYKNLAAIGELPGAGRQGTTLRTLTEYGDRLQAAQEKEQKTGQKDAALNTTIPATMDNALNNVASGDMPHGQVLGLAGKGLSADDAQWLSTQVSDAQKADLGNLNQVIAGAKTIVLGDDPASYTAQSMANYGRAQASAIRNFRRGQAAGIPTEELLDPDSKSFILPHMENYGQGYAAIPPVLHVEGSQFLHPFHMPDVETPTGAGGGGQNNPGNLRVPGSTGTSPQAFQSFPDIDSGIAAVSQQITRYGQRGIDTLRGIISTYSPPNENPTEKLVSNAAARLGVSPDAKLDMANPQVIAGLTQAVLAQEGKIRPSLGKIFAGGAVE